MPGDLIRLYGKDTTFRVMEVGVDSLDCVSNYDYVLLTEMEKRQCKLIRKEFLIADCRFLRREAE